MAHPAQARHGGMFGPHTSHFSLPGQFLLGVLFLTIGSLLLLKKLGKNYLPFIPQEAMIYIAALGSIIGGFYLIVTQIWRPRIYL